MSSQFDMNQNLGLCQICLGQHKPTEMCSREKLMFANKILIAELDRSNKATIKAIQNAKDLQKVVQATGDEMERLMGVEEAAKSLGRYLVDNTDKNNSEPELDGLIENLERALNGPIKLPAEASEDNNKIL